MKTEWTVYVCDKCGDLADGHGEPVGCTNLHCDAPAMRETVVVEATERDEWEDRYDDLLSRCGGTAP